MFLLTAQDVSVPGTEPGIYVVLKFQIAQDQLLVPIDCFHALPTEVRVFLYTLFILWVLTL